MNATNDRFKDRQLHNEDYLQMVSTESKEYAEVSACQRIAENNRIITDFQTDRLLEKTLQPTNLNNAYKKVKSNKGAGGVDGMSVDELLPFLRDNQVQLIQQLKDGKYKPNPVRRVEIPKETKGEFRELGVPTMRDRAMQGLQLLALEPIAETTADRSSFGFRRNRCAQDAMEYMFKLLSRKVLPQWILEGDIKGCFEHISHEWMLKNIVADKRVMKQFLKCGYMDRKRLFPAEEGSPQGGLISPTYANLTLDGMEALLLNKYSTSSTGRFNPNYNKHKVHLCRYADDFIVTADTCEILEDVKDIIQGFLAERGLELSKEKTVITKIEDGFDFLGWNFRKFKGKLLIQPSRKSKKKVMKRLSQTIKYYEPGRFHIPG